MEVGSRGEAARPAARAALFGSRRSRQRLSSAPLEVREGFNSQRARKRAFRLIIRMRKNKNRTRARSACAASWLCVTPTVRVTTSFAMIFQRKARTAGSEAGCPSIASAAAFSFGHRSARTQEGARGGNQEGSSPAEADG